MKKIIIATVALLLAALEEWDASVTASDEGKDYPEGKVLPGIKAIKG